MLLIGNDQIKKHIEVVLNSAIKRNTALPHMLFSGAPGCGKTSLAKEISQISGMGFIQTPPEELKGYKEVLSILGDIDHTGYNKKGDKIAKIRPTIIFVDEIHRMPINGQEKLGIIMEDYKIESLKDKNKFIWFPLFTIVGATTEEGLLSKPFRDRFKLTFNFKLYDIETLSEIVKYHANRLNIVITDKACRDIAKRSRGTPRVAVKYLERVRDFALYKESAIITSKLSEETFKSLNINDIGLTESECELLIILYKIDSPVGLASLSVATNIPQTTLLDSVEPFLIYEGLLNRSGKGRVLTPKGRQYVQVNLLEEKHGVMFKEEITTAYKRSLI